MDSFTHSTHSHNSSLLSCEYKIPSCNRCIDNTCLECKKGLYLAGVVCLPCAYKSLHCLDCTSDGETCFECIAGLCLNNGQCGSCSRRLEVEEGCEVVFKGNLCGKCKAGYVWENWKCFEESDQSDISYIQTEAV